MDKRPTCTHEDAAQLPAGAYAAPIGKCRCCGFLFMYIGMGMGGGSWGDKEERNTNFSELSSPDPNLCPPCGGRPMILKSIGDVVVEYDPGSHGPPTAEEARHYTPKRPTLT